MIRGDGAWWAFDTEIPDSPPKRIGAGLPDAHESVWALQTGDEFLGLAGGDLWSLNAGTGEVSNLTDHFAPLIEHVVWPSASHTSGASFTRRAGRTGRHAVVSALENDRSTLYLLDLSELTSNIPLRRPHENAIPAAYNASTGTVAWTWAGPEGTFLWTSRSDPAQAGPLVRLQLNQHLANVALGESRTILYRNGDGEHMYASILLPVGYTEGETYPLITHVYPGVIIPADAGRAGNVHTTSPQHSLQLFAAMGYAVLYPSIPLPDAPASLDPLLELTSNVLPAVETAISMGIADPDQLALYGHSYGGYAAIALLTQTRRFDVAIASASFADLLGYYSTFEITHRYLPFAHELEQLNMAELEREEGTIRMRSLPWDDQLRYLRNSPISHLQRIETPLLLIHGDLDAAPITQSESVFMGLYRLGKRARFIRYWGEGHTLDSPANIRDYWVRVSDWLESHLRLPDPEAH